MLALLFVVLGTFIHAVFGYERELLKALDFAEARKREAQLREAEATKILYARDIKDAAEYFRAGKQAEALEKLTQWLPQPDQADQRELTWRLLHQEMLQRPVIYYLASRQRIDNCTYDRKGLIFVAGRSELRYLDLDTGTVKPLLDHGELLDFVRHSLVNYNKFVGITSKHDLVYWPSARTPNGIQRHRLREQGRNYLLKTEHPVTALSFDGRWVAVAGVKSGVLVKDLQSGVERQFGTAPRAFERWATPDGFMLHFSSDSKWLIGVPNSYDVSEIIQIWNVATGQPQTTIHPPEGNVFVKVFPATQPDRLVAATDDQDLVEYRVSDGAQLNRWPGCLAGFRYQVDEELSRSNISIKPGRFTYGAESGEVVELDCDARTERILYRFNSEILGLSLMGSDELLAWNLDQVVRLRVSDAHVLGRYRIPEELKSNFGRNFLRSVLYSPESQYFLCAGADGRIALWRLAPEPPSTPLIHSKYALVWATAFSPDGKLLATGGDIGSLRLWNAESRELLYSLKGHSALVTAVAFSPDGRLLATGSYDRSVRVWSVATGECIAVRRNLMQQVTALTWDPAGSRLAVGGRHGHIYMLDVTNDLEFLQDTLVSTKALRALAFHPEGKRLYVSNENHAIEEWDLPTSRIVDSVVEPGEPWTVELRYPYLLTVGNERQISIWNLETKSLVSRWYDPLTPLRGVGWSPDGRTIITGGERGPLRFWLRANGQELGSLDTGSARVTTLCLSPTGRHLAAGCHNGQVYLWPIPAAD